MEQGPKRDKDTMRLGHMRTEAMGMGQICDWDTIRLGDNGTVTKKDKDAMRLGHIRTEAGRWEWDRKIRLGHNGTRTQWDRGPKKDKDTMGHVRREAGPLVPSPWEWDKKQNKKKQKSG